MRITKDEVDRLYKLKLAADAAKAALDKELDRIKAAGENDYSGNTARLVVSQVERTTIDTKAIFAKLKASAALIAKYTKHNPHMQARFTETA